MLNALLFIISLLLSFWLISLVWSQKVAKRVFKFFIYASLLPIIILMFYVGYQSYRWGALWHQLNQQSFDTTKLITMPNKLAPSELEKQN